MARRVPHPGHFHPVMAKNGHLGMHLTSVGFQTYKTDKPTIPAITARIVGTPIRGILTLMPR